MSPAYRAIAVSVISALIVAVVTWATREFAGPSAMEHLKSFAVTFIPLWVGIAVWLMVWASMSIWRVTHKRDDEYTKWLEQRRRDFNAWADNLGDSIKGQFEAKFVKMSEEVRHRGELNSAAMQGFADQFPNQLTRLDERVQHLEEIIKHGLHRG